MYVYMLSYIYTYVGHNGEIYVSIFMSLNDKNELQLPWRYLFHLSWNDLTVAD